MTCPVQDYRYFPKIFWLTKVCDLLVISVFFFYFSAAMIHRLVTVKSPVQGPSLLSQAYVIFVLFV